MKTLWNVCVLIALFWSIQLCSSQEDKDFFESWRTRIEGHRDELGEAIASVLAIAKNTSDWDVVRSLMSNLAVEQDKMNSLVTRLDGIIDSFSTENAPSDSETIVLIEEINNQLTQSTDVIVLVVSAFFPDEGTGERKKRQTLPFPFPPLPFPFPPIPAEIIEIFKHVKLLEAIIEIRKKIEETVKDAVKKVIEKGKEIYKKICDWFKNLPVPTIKDKINAKYGQIARLLSQIKALVSKVESLGGKQITRNCWPSSFVNDIHDTNLQICLNRLELIIKGPDEDFKSEMCKWIKTKLGDLKLYIKSNNKYVDAWIKTMEDKGHKKKAKKIKEIKDELKEKMKDLAKCYARIVELVLECFL